MDMSHNLKRWTEVTGNLPWGVQHVLHETLTLVAEEKVTLVYGQDYREGSPCLINSVGQMLSVGGGQGIPTAHFGPLVSLFDRINADLQSIKGYNDNPGFLSPSAAEVLLRNFAPLKDKPEVTQQEPVTDTTPYREPSDEAMQEWLDNLKEAGPMPEPQIAPVVEPVEIERLY